MIPGTSVRFVETNGVSLEVTEAGKGPLVVLLHGFPELAYSGAIRSRPLPARGSMWWPQISVATARVHARRTSLTTLSSSSRPMSPA